MYNNGLLVKTATASINKLNIGFSDISIRKRQLKMLKKMDTVKGSMQRTMFYYNHNTKREWRGLWPVMDTTILFQSSLQNWIGVQIWLQSIHSDSWDAEISSISKSPILGSSLQKAFPSLDLEGPYIFCG